MGCYAAYVDHANTPAFVELALTQRSFRRYFGGNSKHRSKS